MRTMIDIEELARYLHKLFDCDFVEITEHRILFAPTETLVYCYDANEPRTRGIILPIKVVAPNPKYYEGNQIKYVFDFTKTEEE